MRCTIFDLDGTLADTSGDLIAAANACFADLGYAPQLDPVADAATSFRGGRAMLTLGFERAGHATNERELADFYQRLIDHYGEAIDVHTTLYPGAMDAVETLKQNGFAVGICTNKPEALADRLLRGLGVRDAFSSLVGADTLPVRKPDPAPYFAAVERAGGTVERSMLIGDTRTDRETARAAKVPCALVTFGPAAAEVVTMEPEVLLNSYADLPEIAARLLG